jgi:hypothetical protein
MIRQVRERTTGRAIADASDITRSVAAERSADRPLRQAHVSPAPRLIDTGRMIHRLALLVMIATAACGEDTRPVNVPVVPAGAFEADCQRLCTLSAGDAQCTAKHAEFCLASCRAHTNGLPAACGDCLVAAGTTIHGFIGSFDDPYCDVGGPASVTACRAECDEGTGTPSPDLAALCTLTCAFYMQEPSPLACSSDGAAACLSACTATIGARGRVCAQCLVDQTIPTRSCINGDCDCEPQFSDDPSFDCADLCDAA